MTVKVYVVQQRSSYEIIRGVMGPNMCHLPKNGQSRSKCVRMGQFMLVNWSEMVSKGQNESI